VGREQCHKNGVTLSKGLIGHRFSTIVV